MDKKVVWAPQPGPQAAYVAAPVQEIMYGGARGGGKGLPRECPVLTPFGWKPIGDLKVGDKLCAVDGTVTSVIAKFERGVQPMFRLTMSDGSVVDCDADHIWFAKDSLDYDPADTWTTTDVFEHYQRKGARSRLQIPVISAPAAFDGTTPTSSGARDCGTSLGGAASTLERVPHDLLFASIDTRWELLRGLMDASGWSKESGDCYFDSASAGLVDDVKHLARSLGAVVLHCSSGPGINRIQIKMPLPERMFSLERKRALCAGKTPQSMGIWIDKIEPCEPRETVCIAVSHRSSLFVIENFIVTHNTDGSLGRGLLRGIKYGVDYKAVFIRKELVQLESAIARSKEIYSHFGTYHEQKKRWELKNGASFTFKQVEKHDDAEALQGWNLTEIFVEEIGNYADLEPLLKLKGTLRSTAGVPTAFCSTSNPGGAGQAALKRRYIDPAPGGWEIIREKDALTGTMSERIFIPARITDNQLLLKNDPTYLSRLAQTGSEALVRAWLDGEWSMIDGAYFPEFSVAKHVLPDVPLPKHWLRFRAADWGSYFPFCVLWCAVAAEPWVHPNGRQIPRGAIVVYRELYGSEDDSNKGIKQEAGDVGRLVASLEKGESVVYGVLDPSAFKSDGGPSVAERMASATSGHVMFRRADNTRVGKNGAMGGWDTLRERLRGAPDASGNKVPLLYLFGSCKALIRTLPLAQHDQDNPEDLSLPEDHAIDALRYGVMSRPWLVPAPARPALIRDVRTMSLNELWADHDRAQRSSGDNNWITL
jgi:hypothetical protein